MCFVDSVKQPQTKSIEINNDINIEQVPTLTNENSISTNTISDSDCKSKTFSIASEISLGGFTDESGDEFYDSPGYVPDILEDKSDTDDINENNNFNSQSSSQQLPSFLTVSIKNTSQKTQSITNALTKNNIFDAPIHVQRVKKNPTDNKKVIKNKRVFCLYCERLETNFPRHLERKHALESEVKQFILLPKKHKDRLSKLNF